MADELDLDAIAGNDRTLTVTIDGERHRFPIRSRLTIPQMVRLLRLENMLNEVYANSADDADMVEKTYEAVRTEIMVLIRERTQDAPELGELDENQLQAVLAFIAGGSPEGDRETDETAIADLVAETIADPTRDPDQPLLQSEPEVADGGEHPSVSAPLSPTSSSGSADTTAGSRNGGKTPVGEPSDSTFEQLTPV
ncbi:MAG: hypothetical protein H0V95_11890 [Actinobacteria bacterium]|nr:hypothetical protein [Actinomycetota bacterium]